MKLTGLAATALHLVAARVGFQPAPGRPSQEQLHGVIELADAALDGTLQIGNLPALPLFEVNLMEHTHSNEYIHWTDMLLVERPDGRIGHALSKIAFRHLRL